MKLNTTDTRSYPTDPNKPRGDIGSLGQAVLENAPISGDALAAIDLLQSLKEGKSKQALLDAIGFLPFVGGTIAKVLKKFPRHQVGTELVDTKTLQQFAEFDRRLTADGRATIDSLKKSIQQKGITDPLILKVHPNGRAFIGEGNHRLQAAKELGIEQLPVRVHMNAHNSDNQGASRFIKGIEARIRANHPRGERRSIVTNSSTHFAPSEIIQTGRQYPKFDNLAELRDVLKELGIE